MSCIAAPRFHFRSPLRALLGRALGVAAILLACFGPVRASAQPAGRGPRYVAGEVLLVFQPDAKPEAAQAILRDLGATRIRISRKTRVERHRIRMPVADAVAKYRHHPAIRVIEPNYLIHADAQPNDPSFGIQWSLQNTGQQGGTAGADIRAPAAWDRTTGSNQVIVAIVDTGMDLTHPDLLPNLYTNSGEVPGNALDDDGNGLVDDVHGFDFANFDGDPSDDNGHGTHVAGTIGAQGDNGVGVAGVVWHVRLLPLKFLDAGGTGTTSDAVDCVDYAVLAGASVINASWGSGERSQALELAIANANDAGVLFVAAAGNTGSNNDVFPNYPAGFPESNVISVGSTSRTDERSGFSNYGAAGVDLFAPGTEILSTLPQGKYGLASGTSMAAPHVSGALALLRSRFPAMGAATMKTILLAASDRIPALGSLSVTGGRLNAARMLDGVDSTSPGPIGDVALLDTSSDRVRIVWTATGDDGATGTATEYEVRYATSPLDPASFASATRAAGIPSPHVAGTRETVSVAGLAPLTDYFVALLARDEFGNVSPLSNVLAVRTTAPPSASLVPASISDSLRTGQRKSVALDVRNEGEGFLDFTATALAPGGAPAPHWLSLAPGLGSVRAGGQAAVAVTLNGDGLPGGDYSGLIRFATNDPVRRTLDVPLSMHVTAAPDIEVFPSPMAFGPVVVGLTDTQSVLVTNSGFADLHVTSVAVEGAGYTADVSPFALPPGQSWEIYVSVTPSKTGSITGTLTIASDDPDQPLSRVSLGANGIVPPRIAVAPARQDTTLHTGAAATRAFTLSNEGGSALAWSLRVRSAAALTLEASSAPTPAAAAYTAASTADLSDVRIVFDARHGASSGAWSGLIGSLTSRGAVFTVNPQRLSAAVLDGADVYWVSDDAGAFEAVERAALAAWVRHGGSLVVEGANATALPEFDALLDSVGVPVRYEPDEGITGPTTSITPFEITRGVGVVDLPSSTARLHVAEGRAVVLIEDARGTSAMAASFVERGRVLAVAGRLFADVSAIFADNRMIASQAFDWLGGAAWLGVTPSSGSIAPGQSSVVTVRYDADHLAGADYRAALVVRSNDPERGEFLVPVGLTVRPAPDVTVSAGAVALGPVLVGASGRDSVRVSNVGVLPLRLDSITLDHPDWSTATTTDTLPPGASRAIEVLYTPSAPGPSAATLTIRTDDPDEPEIHIAATGSGLPAPDIDLLATEISAALETGQTATRSITVANRAGSDLEFAVHFEEEAPQSAAAAGGETRLSATPRTWQEARDSGLSLQGRVVAAVPEASDAFSVDSLPLVLVDSRGDGGVMDLLAFRAWARGGVLSVELETGTDITPLNFGGYVSLDLDQNGNTGREPSFGKPRQDIGTELEISLFSVGFGVVDLLDARTGNYLQSFPVVVSSRAIRFAIPLGWLQNDDGRMNVTGVIGNFVGATDWFPESGHGTIGGRWLAPTPASATVPAGQERTVSLDLDAMGLPGGVYHGSVVVESNDPDERSLAVPATLEVTDAPLAAITATRVHLGNVFVGHTAEGSVVVGNEGRAPLTVASVAVDQPDFTASPASFTLPPGETQVVQLTFAPSVAGSHQATMSIAHDAAGGPLTVALTGNGLDAPIVRVEPPAIEATVKMGEKGAASVSIYNGGGSSLEYGVEPLNGAPVLVAGQAGMELARDEQDPRDGIGPVGALGNGGPDFFGYRWVDSSQPGGPIFDWQDIASVGTPVPIQALDQNSGPLPIGFTFPFYGREFTTFNVCTHGWISFTDTTVQYANQPLPTTAAPANLLAVYWDDLNFAGVERATYYNDGTRLIVQFTNVGRRQRGGPFTFQAILYPSGAIVYQYLLMGPPTTSGTIGIQNRAKTDGLNVVFNSEYLHDRMAVRFSAAPSWLGVAQRFGQVAPGESATVAVTLDARGLFAGAYRGTLRIQTNDPAHSETLVPVLLHAPGTPALALLPQELRFDTLDVGGAATDTLRIQNVGTGPLEIASITPGRPDFVATPGALSLEPLQGTTVLVRFAPLDAGDRSTTLTLATNDPAHPTFSIPVTAAARLPVRILEAAMVPAVIRRGSRGEIRARIPMPADLDARRIDLPGVRLQGIVPPDLAATRLRDLDGDGRPDLDIAFPRLAVERVLPSGDPIAIRITGAFIGGSGGSGRFEARGTLRILGSKIAAPGVEFVDADGESAPDRTALRGSAPNPFAAGAQLRFDLATEGRAVLRVYSAGGRLIRSLVSSPLPAGRFRAAWDGRDERGVEAPSGVYFARLEVSGPSPFRGVRRLVRIR